MGGRGEGEVDGLGYVLEAASLADDLEVGVKFIPSRATLTEVCGKPEEEHLSCLVGCVGRTLASLFRDS